MKSILLPFQDDDVAQSALVTAHGVSKKFDSHIEGLFVLPQPQIIAGEGIALPGVYLTQMAEDGKKLSAAAKQRFDNFLSEVGLPVTDTVSAGTKASASWREVEGLESQIIGERGRLFDLIVIARATKYYAGDWNIICEAALFETGRPVLIASEHYPEGFGKKIVIAWNASTESARTVTGGMPFLTQAEEVVVLDTPGAAVPGPSGEELTTHLRRHGIKATFDSVDASSGEATGAAVLDYVRNCGADLLFKCAYTHTRLRQMVFGGVTRHILTHSEVPVLMAH